MKKCLLLIFLTVTLTTYAQEELEKENTTSIEGPLITFNTLPIIYFPAPRYQLGYIQPINERWKVGVDLGYGSEGIMFKTNDGAFESDHYQLFEVRAQAYYMLKSNRRYQQYLSAEVFLLNHQETYFNNDYTTADDLFTVRYESADYSRVKQGLNIKYGGFFDITKRLGVNFSYGFGIRVRDNKFENITGFEIVEGFDDGWGFDSGIRTRQGRNIGLNISLDLKVYYKL